MMAPDLTSTYLSTLASKTTGALSTVRSSSTLSSRDGSFSAPLRARTNTKAMDWHSVAQHGTVTESPRDWCELQLFTRLWMWKYDDMWGICGMREPFKLHRFQMFPRLCLSFAQLWDVMRRYAKVVHETILQLGWKNMPVCTMVTATEISAKPGIAIGVLATCTLSRGSRKMVWICVNMKYMYKYIYIWHAWSQDSGDTKSTYE